MEVNPQIHYIPSHFMDECLIQTSDPLDLLLGEKKQRNPIILPHLHLVSTGMTDKKIILKVVNS